MAILIGMHGEEVRVRPLIGPQFSRSDVQSLLETLDLEMYDIGHERVLICDGAAQGKSLNRRASDLARGHGHDEDVSGFALLAERKELSWQE